MKRKADRRCVVQINQAELEALQLIWFEWNSMNNQSDSKLWRNDLKTAKAFIRRAEKLLANLT